MEVGLDESICTNRLVVRPCEDTYITYAEVPTVLVSDSSLCLFVSFIRFYICVCFSRVLIYV